MTQTAPGADALAQDLNHILALAGEALQALRGENIFVTGGTGFFGRWMLESFARANRTLHLGARMVVLSRNPEAFTKKAPHLGADSGIEFVSGDVQYLDADAVRIQLGRGAPTRYRFVIHAATEVSATGKPGDPLGLADTIVQGTRATLDFAVEMNARRFLLTSSGAVYGLQPSSITHVSENYLEAPDLAKHISAYGEGKRMAERLCACYQRRNGIEPLIARCFAFVGPFLPLDAHFAIGNFIRDALSGGPVRITGDGTPFRSYLYAADLAIWLWILLVRGKAAEPYNVGSERGMSIRDLAVCVAGAAGIAPVVAPAPALTGASRTSSRYVPSTAKIRSDLGVAENVQLEDAIGRTLRWHQRRDGAVRI